MACSMKKGIGLDGAKQFLKDQREMLYKGEGTKKRPTAAADRSFSETLLGGETEPSSSDSTSSESWRNALE